MHFFNFISYSNESTSTTSDRDNGVVVFKYKNSEKLLEIM